MSRRPQTSMYDKLMFLWLLLLLADSSATSSSQQQLRQNDRRLRQQQEHQQVQQGVEPASGFLSFTLDEPISDPSPPEHHPEPTTLAPSTRVPTTQSPTSFEPTQPPTTVAPRTPPPTSVAPKPTVQPTVPPTVPSTMSPTSVAPAIPGEPTVMAQRDTSLPLFATITTSAPTLLMPTQQTTNPPSTTPSLSPSLGISIPTKSPTLPPSSAKPSVQPSIMTTTESPSTRAPFLSPTIRSTSNSQSGVTTTIRPTSRELPTVAPTTTTTTTTTTTKNTDKPTQFPSTVEPLASDNRDTTNVARNTTATPTAVFSSFVSSSSSSPTPPPTQSTEQPCLVSQVQDMLTKASITTQCSIWSARLDVNNLKERVLRSFHTLFCDDQPHDVCFLQHNVVMNHLNHLAASDKDMGGGHQVATPEVRPEDRRIVSEQSSTASPTTTTTTTSREYLDNATNNRNATGLYISINDVTEAHANVYKDNYDNHEAGGATTTSSSGGTVSWSEWKVSWLVVRLGAELVQHVIDESPDIMTDATEAYDATVGFLENRLLQDLNAKILDGALDHFLNIVTNGGTLAVSSITGQEQDTFAPFVTPTVAIILDNNDNDNDNDTSQQQQDDKEKNKSTMYIVWFFAGLLVGFVMVMFLLCATCRPQQMVESALKKAPREPENDEATSARESSLSADGVIDTIGGDNNSDCAAIAADNNEQHGAEDDQEGEHCELQTQSSFGLTSSELSLVDSDVWSVSGIDLKWSV